MPRLSLKRLLPMLALGFGLTLASPPRAHAQDDEDGQQMDDATKEQVQKFQERLQEAIDELQAKDYDNALKHYEKIFTKLEKAKLPQKIKDEIESLAQYNYACGLSLTNKKEEAIKAFARSVQLGFFDWKHIDEDTDLDNIRKEDGFAKAIDAGKALEKSKRKEAGKEFYDATKKALKEPALFDFDFTVKTVDGKDLKLSDLKGKVVIVDFWGTWCPPCRAEIPHFVELDKTYREKGLEIVGLALEHEPDADKAIAGIKDFASENGIKYSLARIDRTDAALKIIGKSIPQFEGGKKLSVPTTLFIDRDGKVRVVKIGLRPFEDLEATATALLDAKAGEGNMSVAKPDEDSKKDEPKKDEPKKDSKKDDGEKPF